MDARSDHSAAHLERFFNLSLDLLCIAGFDGHFKRLSRAWETTFGYTPEEMTSRPFIDFVHPDDRAATVAETEKLAAGVDTISFKNRYMAKDGTYRWLEWSTTALPEEELLLAVARDVTAQHELQEELILLQRLTRTLGEAESLDTALHQTLTAICESAGWSYAGVWVPSGEDETLTPSPAWYEGLPGLAPFRGETEEMRFERGVGLVGRAWSEKRAIWHADLLSGDFTRRASAERAGLGAGVAIPVLDRGEVVAVLDFFLADTKTEDQAFVDLVSSVAMQLGQMIRRRQAEQEVSDLAEKLREQSWEDELTGLRNRRGFLAAAESSLSLAKRTGSEITILFVDLDGMKRINDEFGHAEGDRALKTTAEILMRAVRESDVVSRLGGDEFVLLLWGGDEAETAVRARLEAGLASEGSSPYQLSMSLGAARFDPSSPSAIEALLAKADSAMYANKRSPVR
jgi:diguanylate cyclase (GGDEF)-like protein/PAS domain S-box-containing protein